MKGSSSIQKVIVFILVLLSFSFSFPVIAAPVPPDAGQTSRELQQQPDLAPPETSEPVLNEQQESAEVKPDDAVRFQVSSIRVTGSSVFSSGELEALVADLAGGDRTLAEMEAGAGRITELYRKQGYMVARAYLPAQEIKDGAITIDVLEGRIGELNINNQSRLADKNAGKYLDNIKSGEVLQSKTANRALLLLGDTPGVGGAQASLQPGASVGTSDLIIDLAPSVPYTANITADNYGNFYTGEKRVGADLSIISPLRKGDLISLSALTSELHLTHGRAAYQVPFGGSGLRLGAAYSASRYRIGKDLSGLQAHGSSLGSSLYAVYPFIRDLDKNLNGTFMYERKKLIDSLTSSDKRVGLTTLGLSGNLRDNLGGLGSTSFEVSAISGRLSMDDVSRSFDQASAKSNGDFAKLSYSFKRVQQLPLANSLSLDLSGQRAGKNLNSSEKLYLGGADSVRAYPQGEASGDEGFQASLELRRNVGPAFQAFVFYDAGSIKINRNNYAAGSNSRYLAGAGIGAEAMLAGLHLKANVAWRTSSSDPVSEPSVRQPRLWLLAGKQF